MFETVAWRVVLRRAETPSRRIPGLRASLRAVTAAQALPPSTEANLPVRLYLIDERVGDDVLRHVGLASEDVKQVGVLGDVAQQRRGVARRHPRAQGRPGWRGTRIRPSATSPTITREPLMPSSQSPDSTSIDVRHEPDRSRYSATVDGAVAVANYHRQGNVIAFTHTEVPKEIAGRGVASAIARRALDDARAAGNQVVPACEFFAHYMDEHREYDDLRATKAAGEPR